MGKISLTALLGRTNKKNSSRIKPLLHDGLIRGKPAAILVNQLVESLVLLQVLLVLVVQPLHLLFLLRRLFDDRLALLPQLPLLGILAILLRLPQVFPLDFRRPILVPNLFPRVLWQRLHLRIGDGAREVPLRVGRPTGRLRVRVLVPGQYVARLVALEVGIICPALLLSHLPGQQGLAVLNGKVHNRPAVRAENIWVVIQVPQQ